MHPLDDFDAYLSRWIDELQKPDTKNDGGYTGGTCPFAKSAWDKNRIKVCKIYDYNETYDFWSVVGKELETFDRKDNDIVVVASMYDPSLISSEWMSGAIDALNSLMSVQKKDIWLLWGSQTYGHSPIYSVVLIQHLSDTIRGSMMLEDQGYYVNRMPDDDYKHLVTERKKMGDLL